MQEAIKAHFLIKRQHILRVVRGWLKEAKKSDTAGHYAALKKQADDLKQQLNTLGPAPYDEAKYAVEEEEDDPERKQKV